MVFRTTVICVVLALASSAVDAQIFNFDFPINVEQEVPPPTIPAGTMPSGTGQVTLDTDLNMLSWVIDYQGLSGPIVAPGAHFHGPAEPGATAGVQVFLTTGDPPEPATGQLVGSAMITDQQELDILDGLWYVNIHTDLNGPGEIRGQVVPEPSACWLLLIAAGLVGRLRK